MFAAKFDIVLSYEQNDDRNVRIGRIWTREICGSGVDIKGRVKKIGLAKANPYRDLIEMELN